MSMWEPRFHIAYRIIVCFRVRLKKLADQPGLNWVQICPELGGRFLQQFNNTCLPDLVEFVYGS